MYRLMQPSDEAAVVALWQKERGDSAEFIKTALEKFAGAENIYVAEENDEIVAAALAVPVTLKGRSGSYLYGLCGQGSLILAGLVDYLCAQQKLRGAGFTVAVPAGQEQAALLENKGFQRAFALRCLPREVSRNLWSQAEFDSVTARKLCELRERFYPDTVQFPPEQMAVVLTDLYARGATIVSNEKGYGIYFRREDTFYFVELMADDDRSAEVLMEAAREVLVLLCGPLPQLGLGGVRGLFGQHRADGVRRHTGGDVAHTGPAYLSVHAGADRHGQKQGLAAPFQMPEDVLPLQNTGLREALHVGLEPDGPGRGGGEKGRSALFQKGEGSAVSLAPRAEIPRGLPDVDGLRLC